MSGRRYVSKANAEAVRLNLDVANIHRSGSVLGMQLRYPRDWHKKGQVRVGGWIYNVGPAEVDRLRGLGVLRGDK